MSEFVPNRDLRAWQTLYLPSGELAIRLRLGPLQAEMRRLGIPFDPHDGKGRILDAYERRILEEAGRLRRKGEPITEKTMRAAARALDPATAPPAESFFKAAR